MERLYGRYDLHRASAAGVAVLADGRRGQVDDLGERGGQGGATVVAPAPFLPAFHESALL